MMLTSIVISVIAGFVGGMIGGWVQSLLTRNPPTPPSIDPVVFANRFEDLKQAMDEARKRRGGRDD